MGECIFFFGMETIGQRIRRFARARYKTQRALADACGMTEQQLGDYVNDRIRSPGVDVLEKLAGAGVSLDWLLLGKGEMDAGGARVGLVREASHTEAGGGRSGGGVAVDADALLQQILHAPISHVPSDYPQPTAERLLELGRMLARQQLDMAQQQAHNADQQRQVLEALEALARS